MWIAVIVAVMVAVWVSIKAGLGALAVKKAVAWRLGGYRHRAVVADASQPRRVTGEPPRVAVIGAGLGGIGASSALAERGFSVVLYERNHYLGGKIGAWKAQVVGEEHTVDHGFHAFFRQYYNLNRFLDRLGLRESFREIEDYLIIDGDGREHRFGEVETAPALNIVDLGRRGFYRWRDVIRKATRSRLTAFVQFDMERTYDTLDQITFEQFCEEAALPPELRVSFRTFARAFFSDETDLSTADVLRAFHFYYLSHDHGLMYDYPVGNYEEAILEPIRRHLELHGVDIRLIAPVEKIERGENRRFSIATEEYDWVVIAADVPGAKTIIDASEWMSDAAPELVADIAALRASHGYAIWRMWVDRDLRPGLPTFINVDRKRVLDSVTLYHRVTAEARAWAETHDGAILELHSYALPADIGDESELRRAFLEELQAYFPEVAGIRIVDEVLQVRRDFPAFFPGQRAHRPTPRGPIQGLLFAGDWVRLPYPMTHMEAAYTSGLMCANEIFDRHGLQLEPIETVAPKGLLAAAH